MAATVPLHACDPTTIWYDFTYPLSWSHECEVAEVLSDIPSISVGILVFGVSALFLVMKRVSLSAVSLFFSALLAFIAAVLDLGKTLADGMAMDTTFVTSGHVIRAREVLFALSIGFRFLFYWSYVAEPSRKDLSAAATQRVQRIGFLFFEYTHETHNESWRRWGFPGKLVGAGLLVAIIIITALQIVWRVVPQFHQYSNVYATDVALELLVSFLFLLKLLLNAVTLNSVDSMLVHTFSECLAPIFGLLVNIAIAVGDLLYFAFTESTVGRLLQAFEVYVIAVSVMVTAFLGHRDILLSTTSPQSKNRRDVAFILPEPARGSTFRITPPLIETPRMSTVLDIATQNKESNREMFHRSARRSLNHVSSWLSFRISRHRSPHEDEEVKLWNAEKVKVDPPYTGDIDTELRASIEASTQASRERLELVRDAPANHMPIISASDTRSAIARPVEDSIHSGQILRASPADVPQYTIPLQVRTSTVPVSPVLLSICGARHAEGITIPPEASPVYGLGGIQSLANASDSRTSLDELLRQQSQLDQCMDALRLPSAETSTNPSYSNSNLNARSVGLTRSPSTGQRTVCSDISLSNFPIPPRLTTPVPPLPPSSSSSIKRIRGGRRVRLAVARPILIQDTHTLVPPKTLTSLVDIPGSPRFNSIPHTPTGEENESLSAEAGKFSHSDSGGTQYNVTSFIHGRMFAGSSDSISHIFEDLATPGGSCQGSQEKPWWPAENGSSFGTIETGSDMKKLPPHMLPVPRQLERLPSAAKISPFTRPSRLSQDAVDEPAEVMHYQTNDQTSRSLTIALSPQIPVTDRAEKDASRPPRRSSQLAREAGSVPTTVSPEGVERVQRMFVRRRPPPLVIQPYAEHNPGTSRVQVLADD